MIQIPNKITIGGQEIEVNMVERCDDNSLGLCNSWRGVIEIADKFNKDSKQSDTSKINTFYHEVIHAILDIMGEKELSENERFVCSFAGFLTDAMRDARFIQDNIPSRV